MMDTFSKTSPSHDKSDITLIRLRIKGKQFHLPLPSLALGSYLEIQGHRSEIVDLNLFSENNAHNIVQKLNRPKLNLFGITVYYGQLISALKFSKALKKTFPGSTIVLGGPGVFDIEHKLLEKFSDFIDIIVRGEGERPLLEIVRMKEEKLPFSSLENIKGISYSEESRIHINHDISFLKSSEEYPPINYDLVNVKEYFKKSKYESFDLIVGQGCPYNCKFCSTSNFWDKKYRIKTAEQIINEIQRIKNRYGINRFNFIHDNFLSSKKRFYEVLALRNKRGLSFSWSFASRIDNLTKDVISSLEDSGVNSIFFGIETADVNLQQEIGKKLKLEDFENKILALLDEDITVHLSYITGFPTESEAQRQTTFKHLFKYASLPGILVNYNELIILPGSNYYNRYRSFPNQIRIEKIRFLINRFPKTVYTLLSSNITLDYLLEKITSSSESQMVCDMDLYISHTKDQDNFLKSVFNYENSIYELQKHPTNLTVLKSDIDICKLNSHFLKNKSIHDFRANKDFYYQIKNNNGSIYLFEISKAEYHLLENNGHNNLKSFIEYVKKSLYKLRFIKGWFGSVNFILRAQYALCKLKTREFILTQIP